ncbi:MAG TPA: hypothetical protein VIX59_20340 [Candidatus Binataceae bacterium]
MSELVDPVHELAVLLAEVGARPRLEPQRIAPSTLYDTHYHLAVVACAFGDDAKPGQDGRRRILAPWLKLLQFVAARPQLAPDLRAWAGTRRNADLDTWRRMPRGYVGDRTHDGIVEFLVAAGILDRDKPNQLVAGRLVGLLDALYDRIKATNLFTNERRVLEELRVVHASRTMLEGA